MKPFNIVTLFCASILTFSCSSSFFISDTEDISGISFDYNEHKLPQPPKSPKEEEYAESLKYDKLIAGDFLKYLAIMFENVFGVAIREPGAPVTNQRFPNELDIEYDAHPFIDDMLHGDTARSILCLNNLYAEEAAALISAGFPILAFGTANYKHSLRNTRGMAILNVYDCFTFIISAKRIKAEKTTSSYSMDQIRDKYVFDTREGFGVITDEKKPLQGVYVDMRFPPEEKGKWNFKKFFVVLGGGRDTSALPAKFREYAAKSGNPIYSGGFKDVLTGNYHYETTSTEDGDKKEKKVEPKMPEIKLPPPPPPPVIIFR